jgi:carbon-monoxide dehydrogenase medium subunit
VSVATYLTFNPDNRDRCKDIRIVMGSVGPTPLRSKRGENLLKGKTITDTLIEEAARLSAEDAQPTTDINGSEDYKREIIGTIAQPTLP